MLSQSCLQFSSSLLLLLYILSLSTGPLILIENEPAVACQTRDGWVCTHQWRRSVSTEVSHQLPDCSTTPSPALCEPVLGSGEKTRFSTHCLSLQWAFSALLTPPFTFHLLQALAISVYYCLLVHYFSSVCFAILNSFTFTLMRFWQWAEMKSMFYIYV